MVKAREAIQKGFNIGIFPEGGIKLTHYPKMVSFKDGAFKLAVENELPIIPVTFPDNYRIQQDDHLFDIRRIRCRIIYHAPIWPKGKTEEDVKQLKDEVFRVIQTELDKEAHGIS